jgi:hypothetical protein
VTHQRTPQIHHGFHTIRCSSSIYHAQCRRLLRSQNSERGRKIPRPPERQKTEQNVSSKTNNQNKTKTQKTKQTHNFLLLLRLLFFPLSVYTRSIELLVYNETHTTMYTRVGHTY